MLGANAVAGAAISAGGAHAAAAVNGKITTTGEVTRAAAAAVHSGRGSALINTPRSSAYAAQLRAFGLEVDDSTGDNVVNLKKVMAGHGRFFYINEQTLNWMMEQPQFKGKVCMVDWVVKEEPIYFHVGKKAPAGAAQLIGQALAELKGDGALARIYASGSRPR
jgi:polar amino acid transport system substrate-binding protein